MAFSWKDPHFILKLITLILLILILLAILIPSGAWSYNFMIEALTYTSTIVILVLIITIVFFESPKATEICLIISVILMLAICCGWWMPHYTSTNVNGHYVVFSNEYNRRNAYLGLAIPGIIVEIIDIILHALKK